MALSQADLQVIQTVFGKTAEELSGALSSDQEVSLGLRLNGRVISQEDERLLKETSVKQGKEIGYKEVAKNLGIELESGEKDPVIIADKLKSSITTTLVDKYKNMQPTEELELARSKAEEWENKYNKLNGTYEETKNSVTEWESKYSKLEGDIRQKDVNNTILKTFPEKMKMDRSDALLIARNAFEFEQTENGLIAKRNGQIVTDAVGNPEKIDNVIASFVEEKKWIKQSGMGGTDRSSTGMPKFEDYDKAIAYVREAGKDPMSPEGSKMLKELTA